MHGVARLVDRRPTVSPERLIAQLTPPPTFADASFAAYHPDPAEPTQSAAVAACRRFRELAVERRAGRKKVFGRRVGLPGTGLYLDGGFGVGKTHLLAATYRSLPDDAVHPKAFATFIELTQLAGGIDGPDYRHRDSAPAPQPPSDEDVAARAAAVAGATLDEFDALCAHLATMHPSRYLALLDGVTAVCLTGVHTIEDQNVALRLVALTDRLYDAGIPVLASGDKLDRIFSAEMLAGGFRKKYLRATSRVLALSAAVTA
jgi:predicted ATPase